MKITATEFQKNIGRFQDKALSEPVVITKNGRAHTVLISAELFEIAVRGRKAQRVETLDAQTLGAIRRAEVDSRYDHLDDLLKES